MIGNQTFAHLNLALQKMKDNFITFRRSVCNGNRDLMQLPPVKQQAIFMNPHKGCYEALHGSLWQELFKLHELVDIVRQISDPTFASILSRIREGNHTDDDMDKIKALEDTDTLDWPNEYVKLFLTNYLAGEENENAIANLNSEVYSIRAEDSGKDLETGTYRVSIPEHASLNQTGNLPTTLKLCIGARFMLTDNISVADRLINGSIGTVRYLNFNKNYPLLGENIYQI